MADSVQETAPFPHALSKSGQASTTHSHTHSFDGFPELDSELLQVCVCVCVYVRVNIAGFLELHVRRLLSAQPCFVFKFSPCTYVVD